MNYKSEKKSNHDLKPADSLRSECLRLQATLVVLRNQNKIIQKSIDAVSAEKLSNDLNHLKREFYLTELQTNLDKLV